MILTLGARGVMYRDRPGGGFDLPADAIDLVRTCGCGDCFKAGFATGLHLDRCIEDCVLLGQAASAQKAMSLGSQAVVSSLERTTSFVENTPSR